MDCKYKTMKELGGFGDKCEYCEKLQKYIARPIEIIKRDEAGTTYTVGEYPCLKCKYKEEPKYTIFHLDDEGDKFYLMEDGKTIGNKAKAKRYSWEEANKFINYENYIHMKKWFFEREDEDE